MNELFTIREVALKLKISVSSVYRYVENGSFPHTKIGSNIRFTQEHIAAFLAQNKKKNEPTELNAPPSTAHVVDFQTIEDQWQ